MTKINNKSLIKTHYYVINYLSIINELLINISYLYTLLDSELI